MRLTRIQQRRRTVEHPFNVYQEFRPIAKKFWAKYFEVQQSLEAWMKKHEIKGGTMVEEPVAMSLKLGFWTCPESPILVCFYNEIEDSALDHCLICGNPHERK